MFRKSLDDREAPSLFRTAIVAPVHKKGPSTEAKNKRPVSMTAVPCKLLESVLCNAIYQNANFQGLITGEQFAYRPGLSTTLQLLETQNDWALTINESKCLDVAYFDFRSAFEKVTHCKLRKMLPFFGVGPKLIKWSAAFLRDRTFRVKINETLSNFGKATSGCPQGTLIDPLMYILYTNSLGNILTQNVRHKVYADDMKIYMAVNDDKACQIFQKALNKFYEWSTKLHSS